MGFRFAALEGPARELADDLRRGGAPLLAAQLSEWLPDASNVGSDAHRPALVDRLLLVSVAADLPDSIRIEADRLVAVAQDLPTALGRIGRAWIAWDDGAPAAGPGYYDLSWQTGAEGGNDLYEDGPKTSSIEKAIAWGRHRTDDVVIRPEWDPGTYYWAGIGDAPVEFPALPSAPDLDS